MSALDINPTMIAMRERRRYRRAGFAALACGSVFQWIYAQLMTAGFGIQGPLVGITVTVVLWAVYVAALPLFERKFR